MFFVATCIRPWWTALLFGLVFLTACVYQRQPPQPAFQAPGKGTYIIRMVRLTSPGGEREARIACITETFLLTSRVRPVLGRVFLAEEFSGDFKSVAMLSYAYWSEGFGKDPSALGRTLHISEEPHTIVGVLPEGFLVEEDVSVFGLAGGPACP